MIAVSMLDAGPTTMTTNSDSPTSSRRDAIQRVGVGIAAAPALMAAAAGPVQSASTSPPATRPTGVEDPRELYPKPPFPAQQQPRPGWPSA